MKVTKRIKKLLDRLAALEERNAERADAHPDNVLTDYRYGKAAAYRRSRSIVLEELGDILEVLQKAEEMESGR